LSISKRKQATQKERSLNKAKLARFADSEVMVDDQQSDDFANVMDKIEKSCSKELEEVFKDAEVYSCGKPMREVWENDKRSAKIDFYQDQASNSKHIMWMLNVDFKFAYLCRK